VYATATPSSTLMLQEIRNFWQRYVVSPTIQTVLAAFSCSIGRGVEQHASVQHVTQQNASYQHVSLSVEPQSDRVVTSSDTNVVGPSLSPSSKPSIDLRSLSLSPSESESESDAWLVTSSHDDHMSLHAPISSHSTDVRV
jgi:hypothetical protein